jgi:exonuclease SbcC
LIEEVNIRGFKSFSHSQTIRFSKGVNKISGRNAAGKTTILEAIIYGLFGEVPGVDKRQLVTIGSEDLHIQIKFRSPLNGKAAVIVRDGVVNQNNRTGELSFRSTKNVLEVEGESPITKITDIQEKLKELFGIGRTTFLNVVYAKQKEFIDIVRPRDEKRMDAMLGLTTPSEIREQLKETRKILETQGHIQERGKIEERIKNALLTIDESETLLQGLHAQFEYLIESLENSRKLQREAKDNLSRAEELWRHAQQVEKQSNTLEQLKASRDTNENNLIRIYESFDSDPNELMETLESQFQAAKGGEQRLQKLIDGNLNVERRELDSTIARLSHQIKEHSKFREQGLTTCPKCGQDIDFDLIEDDIEKWNNVLEEKSRRLTVLENEIATIKEQVKAVRLKGDRIRDQLVELRSKMRQVEDLKSAIEELDFQGSKLYSRISEETESLLNELEKELIRDIASIDVGVNYLETKIGDLRSVYNEITKGVGEKEGELRSIERQRKDLSIRLDQQRNVLQDSEKTLNNIEEYEAKIRTLEAILDRYSVYERELRENTIKLLEYRTYEYFQRLTDQQIYSGFHIDREKYVLEVQPIDSPRTLPAWRAGGGHESLLALAERLALLRVMNFPHMLILDEPTDAVDSENVPQLLDYIAKTSTEIGQVLLVTHHGYGDEQGVNLINVSKIKGESKAEQEF